MPFSPLLGLYAYVIRVHKIRSVAMLCPGAHVSLSLFLNIHLVYVICRKKAIRHSCPKYNFRSYIPLSHLTLKYGCKFDFTLVFIDIFITKLHQILLEFTLNENSENISIVVLPTNAIPSAQGMNSFFVFSLIRLFKCKPISQHKIYNHSSFFFSFLLCHFYNHSFFSSSFEFVSESIRLILCGREVFIRGKRSQLVIECYILISVEYSSTYAQRNIAFHSTRDGYDAILPVFLCLCSNKTQYAFSANTPPFVLSLSLVLRGESTQQYINHLLCLCCWCIFWVKGNRHSQTTSPFSSSFWRGTNFAAHILIHLRFVRFSGNGLFLFRKSTTASNFITWMKCMWRRKLSYGILFESSFLFRNHFVWFFYGLLVFI